MLLSSSITAISVLKSTVATSSSSGATSNIVVSIKSEAASNESFTTSVTFTSWLYVTSRVRASVISASSASSYESNNKASKTFPSGVGGFNSLTFVP